MEGGEGGSGGKGYVYIIMTFILLYGRNHHRIVEQFLPIKN